MSTTLHVQQENGIAVLTLNRPEAANALSRELLENLERELERLSEDQETRAIVITSATGRVFCAGADLKERSQMSEQEVHGAIDLIKRTINKVSDMPQPVICAGNGSAMGGGLELALAADIRVGAEEAKYGLTETSLGIIPGAGGTQRLPRLIGPGKAKELIYTAKRLTGKEAEKLGILEHCVPMEEVVSTALTIAKAIAKNGPIAVKQAKVAIDDGLDTDLDTGLTIETKAYETTIPTEDRLEGIQAFKEKRTPQYTGK